MLETWNDGARLVLAALFVVCQLLLAVYGFHRYVLVARDRRRRAGPAPRAPAAADLPAVTVQLPICNEPRVVARLIDAVCRLDYPADRLEIQVLDDSTDATTGRARERAAFHQARGIGIRVLHRAERAGYKAGALRAGLAEAQGEFVALFDADFLPPRDFLRRAVAAFDGPRVGMVQARWGHLNRDHSLLTDLQAVLLDGHFLIEQPSRAAHGAFFNFNGTAGVWRRSCIEAAGGWQSDTLTEDLDLSYRAQLAGWSFRFLEDLVVPAELPVDIAAFQAQQRRWARGSLQTARKVLPRLWQSRLPLAVKVEAFFHLTSNLSYPLLLVSALLLPVALFPPRDPGWLGAGFWAGLFAAGTVGVIVFFGRTLWRRGDRGLFAALRVPGALILGAGMSLAQSRAVFEGLTSWGGRWERTAKHGVLRRGQAWRAEPWAGRLPLGAGETFLALYFLAVAAQAMASRQWAPVPFLAFLVAGFLYIGQISARRPAAAGPLH
jgi:cellulose synthase/poly-beta-1,6-N-acetylglucosamine synthase-like glycosyltransferase